MELREHRFFFLGRDNTHVFHIEELVSGLAAWPAPCRLKLPATSEWPARRFYGADCWDVASQVAAFLGEHYATSHCQPQITLRPAPTA